MFAGSGFGTTTFGEGWRHRPVTYGLGLAGHLAANGGARSQSGRAAAGTIGGAGTVGRLVVTEQTALAGTLRSASTARAQTLRARAGTVRSTRTILAGIARVIAGALDGAGAVGRVIITAKTALAGALLLIGRATPMGLHGQVRSGQVTAAATVRTAVTTAVTGLLDLTAFAARQPAPRRQGVTALTGTDTHQPPAQRVGGVVTPTAPGSRQAVQAQGGGLGLLGAVIPLVPPVTLTGQVTSAGALDGLRATALAVRGGLGLLRGLVRDTAKALGATLAPTGIGLPPAEGHIPWQHPTQAGTTASLDRRASAAGDVFANLGQQILYVRNTHPTARRTVTVVAQRACSFDTVTTQHDRVVVVEPETTTQVGPFPVQQFSDERLYAHVTYSHSAQDLLVAVGTPAPAP